MLLGKWNKLIERFNRYELQKGGNSKPRNVFLVVANP